MLPLTAIGRFKTSVIKRQSIFEPSISTSTESFEKSAFKSKEVLSFEILNFFTDIMSPKTISPEESYKFTPSAFCRNSKVLSLIL